VNSALSPRLGRFLQWTTSGRGGWRSHRDCSFAKAVTRAATRRVIGLAATEQWRHGDRIVAEGVARVAPARRSHLVHCERLGDDVETLPSPERAQPRLTGSGSLRGNAAGAAERCGYLASRRLGAERVDV
jgi:hypothetical protein